ncbi:STAS domain-containing protein [Streptomyces sp. NPDC058412]|uniref:STAS domain-containing protein n=1 Tax=Streptomyces sp. NPDC058412 TaxID=3346486 RepID=UPI00365EAE32
MSPRSSSPPGPDFGARVIPFGFPPRRHSCPREPGVTRPQGSAEIVVDLTDLTFCDSAGLNALLQARPTAQGLGRRVQLHDPSRQMTRLLERTGADQFFPATHA